MKAHFFDIDTLVNYKGSPWIIDKTNPTVPIMKIPISDFNLIKSGIYRIQNNKMEFNGKVYWLPSDLYLELKIKSKNANINFANLAISLNEFINKKTIENVDLEYSLDEILTISNKVEDIYIICGGKNKKNYRSIVEKLLEVLKSEEISVKGVYYISDTFYSRNTDLINYKKMKLSIQHLIGYKTEGDKFIDKEIKLYNEIFFYDHEPDTLKYVDEINYVFNKLLNSTEDNLKSIIKEDLLDNKPYITFIKINENKVNRKNSKKTTLTVTNIIRTFEAFKINENKKG